ncbi:transposase [Amphritea opalescens]|uniref:Transposase n=1 Tax=Amphritea opalescens TaxID=2490544 RepID=A0A430KM63_9GAMM|nr:transposase [Amphritea opalescens]RTE64567.1 transposase [Amphritea opalescens]
MTRPRQELVSLQNTPYYHVVSRCVRRSYLCGADPISGKNYDHRRQWIEDRIRILSSLFAIDVCAYAVMSNHHHLVIKICPDQAQSWTDMDVANRWTSLFKGPLLVRKWISGESLSAAEIETVSQIIEVYRERLSSLSWFMKCLNEPIARQANQEDQCTGHFWESRFKSQALLSEEALLSCMAYVDLNPIRSEMAETPEDSAHTSIKERINPAFDLNGAILSQQEQKTLQHFDYPIKPLAPLKESIKSNAQTDISCCLKDYLELVDNTGRTVQKDKRGAIPLHHPSILERLRLDSQNWLRNATEFEQLYPKKFAARRQAKQRSKQIA